MENIDNGDSWPIIIIVYSLINRNPKNIKKSNLTIKFFNWLFKNCNNENFIKNYMINNNNIYNFRCIPEREIKEIENKMFDKIDKIGDININIPLNQQIDFDNIV